MLPAGLKGGISAVPPGAPAGRSCGIGCDMWAEELFALCSRSSTAELLLSAAAGTDPATAEFLLSAADMPELAEGRAVGCCGSDMGGSGPVMTPALCKVCRLRST